MFSKLSAHQVESLTVFFITIFALVGFGALMVMEKPSIHENSKPKEVCINGHLYYSGYGVVINDFGGPVECNGGCPNYQFLKPEKDNTNDTEDTAGEASSN